jgi:hypothetical protein
MKLKRFLIPTLFSITLFVLLSSDVYGQFGKNFKDQDEQHMTKRIFTGGSLGFWIYSIDGYIYVSPLVGYHISPSFDVGVRLSYSYYWYNDNLLKFDLNSYGGAIFGRYYLFFLRDLFIHLEYEYISAEQPVNTISDSTKQALLINPNIGAVVVDKNNTDKVETDRIPVNNFYIGAGFRQWLSPSVFLSITVLFNLNETEYSAQNPILRIGFGVGL